MNILLLAGLSLMSVAQTNSAPPPIMPAGIDSRPVDPSQHLTPDELWAQIGQDGKQVMDGLQNHDPVVQKLMPRLQIELTTYLTKFSNEPHVPDAKLMSAQVNDLAHSLQLPGAPSAAAVAQQFNALANDLTLPIQLRAEASLMTITSSIQQARTANNPAAWDDLDAKISGFEKNFGTISFGEKISAAAMLRDEQIKLLRTSGDTARLNALLGRLAHDPDPAISALATQAAQASQPH